MRSQLLWLINDKDHKEELETVVRDLWDLRIRGFSALVPEENTGEGELEMFSSQPSSDAESGVERPKVQTLSWDPERGTDWPIPRLVDTLSMCYLGCLLLRIPTRIGDFLRWANGGNIPYKQVVSLYCQSILARRILILPQYYELPQEIRDRMLPHYTTVFKWPLHTPLEGGELHQSVRHLASGYHYNYGMIFPRLNEVPMMVQYAKHLSLPSLSSSQSCRDIS